MWWNVLKQPPRLFKQYFTKLNSSIIYQIHSLSKLICFESSISERTNAYRCQLSQDHWSQLILSIINCSCTHLSMIPYLFSTAPFEIRFFTSFYLWSHLNVKIVVQEQCNIKNSVAASSSPSSFFFAFIQILIRTIHIYIYNSYLSAHFVHTSASCAAYFATWKWLGLK